MTRTSTVKNVYFEPTVTLYCVSSYKDTPGVWYTRDELNQLEAENNSIGRQMIQQQQQQPSPIDGHFQYCGSLESVDCTTRGLERFSSNSSSIGKAMGQRSRQTVLEEQDRQRVLQQLHDSSSSLSDSDLHIADAYSFLAAPSMRDAHHRAMCDAQTSRKDVMDDDEEAVRKLLLSRDRRQKERCLRSGPTRRASVAA